MSSDGTTGFDRLVSCDVVVIGSGVAGLTVALHAPSLRVTILSKSGFAKGGSSPHAQGGVAAALGADDAPGRHAQDTLAAGAGLCDPEVVWLVTEQGPDRIREIERLGAQFDREPAGQLALGREAAHSRRRIVHAAGDATGAELVRTLAESVRQLPNVCLEQQMLALDLVIECGRAVGVVAAGRDGELVLYAAPTVVLASGGIGQVFRHTTNPAEATGDGLAMAARAGARLAGLEFMQFHPTALDVGGNPMPLLTEALRGEGAQLVDERGDRFMRDVHPLAELAPRDVVARAIWRHALDGHRVLLDATGLAGRIAERFPTVLELCLERGLDPRRAPLPVAPAAHYHMGGVVVDREGRTSIAGLWACGEVAHTGLHGANRLASNSLLEALVFGARVGEELAAAGTFPGTRPPQLPSVRGAGSPWLEDVGESIAARLRQVMWTDVGLERTAPGLRFALSELRRLRLEAPAGPGELCNMLTVASLVARAAWARTESRGAHFRSDVPWQDPHWRQDLVFEGLEPVAPRPVAVAAG